jgi:hypothetical protein
MTYTLDRVIEAPLSTISMPAPARPSAIMDLAF